MGILNFLKIIEPLETDICKKYIQMLIKPIVDYFVYLTEGHETGVGGYGTTSEFKLGYKTTKIAHIIVF